MRNAEGIYIIGAGISGLIAAFELEQAGYQPIIIEKTDGVGGRVKTIQEKEFALDLGFQVLLSAYPLANKYLDIEGLDLIKLESGALIYANGTSYRIGDPLRNWKMLVPTLLANVGTISDKLKILGLNKKLKNKSIEEIFASPEHSTYDYLRNFGFSNKIIDIFFKPFFAGIFLEPNLNTSSRMFEFVYKMFGEGFATIPKLGIGEISQQLKRKLVRTAFIFNAEVSKVTTDFIYMQSGEKKSHQGVIISANASSLVDTHAEKVGEIAWKSCSCFYFEVDQTNIPRRTIALVADPDKYANNLYAYTDINTGKTILSVTTLKEQAENDAEIVDQITAEVKQYLGSSMVSYIQRYTINEALPAIQNLKMTARINDIEVLNNVFLAGDHLLNGSLNAAMESGRLAAAGIVQKNGPKLLK